MSWRTTHEVDLDYFNVVVINQQGERIQQNETPIVCEQCVTGLGASYATPVLKHRSGRNFFVEMVHVNGFVETFGPAARE